MDRLLTCNVGNTNTQIASWMGDRMERVVQFATHKLDKQRLKFAKPDHVLAASTVPEAADNLGKLVKSLYGLDVKFIGRSIDFGVKIDYEGLIGQDRIANIAAGYNIAGKDCIVIDFGTATTIEVIIKGVYMGGLIFAGIDLGLRALHRYTSLLPKIIPKRIEKIEGRNTDECMSSGAYWGEIARIGGLIEMIREEYKRDLVVLTTGGLGEEISKELGYRYDRWLTLRGIRFIASRIRSKKSS